MTDDDPIVDLPDDFLEIRALGIPGQPLVNITQRGMADNLSYLAEASAEDLWSTGPVVYSFEGPSRIRIQPAPQVTGTRTITLYYYATADAWSADDDEPTALPRAFHLLPAERVVEWQALAEEDPNLALAAKTRADQMEGELRRLLEARNGLGRSTVQVRGLTVL